MRTLAIYGFIGLYIACAFVPPSGSTLATEQAFARSILQETSRVSLVAPELQSTKRIQDTARALERMAKDPRLTSMVTAGSSSSMSPDTLLHAASLLRSTLPTAPTVQRKVSRVLRGSQPPTSAAWKKLLTDESDPRLRSVFGQIDRAAKAMNPVDCRSLDRFTPSTSGPTRGDVIALCLAKTFRNADRCRQIDQRTAGVLRSLCTTELETSS